MKLASLIATIMAIAFSATGQHVTISLPTHLAKWPFNNYYLLQAQNIPCKNIVVKADQGLLEQNGCQLFYRPDSMGMTVFRVYTKTRNGLHLIDTIPIWVKEERVSAILGVLTGGQVHKNEILNMGGVLLRRYLNDGHAEPVHLISYKVIISRGDSTWSIQNMGTRFSTQTISLLQNLQQGDKLIIADIKGTSFKELSITADPFEFTIN